MISFRLGAAGRRRVMESLSSSQMLGIDFLHSVVASATSWYGLFQGHVLFVDSFRASIKVLRALPLGARYLQHGKQQKGMQMVRLYSGSTLSVFLGMGREQDMKRCSIDLS